MLLQLVREVAVVGVPLRQTLLVLAVVVERFHIQMLLLSHPEKH
jgi:hypothetical protein